MSIFNQETHSQRTRRYVQSDAFYNSTIYGNINIVRDGKVRKITRNAYVTSKHLYTLITCMYNPVKRLVDFYAAHVMAGKLPDALPIMDASGTEDAPEVVVEAIKQIWRWSSWQKKKTLYIRHGALYGDSVLRVQASNERISLNVLHPSDIVAVNWADDKLEFVKLEWPAYTYDERGDRTYYTYGEVITLESFSTYKDGQLFAFDGNPGDTWDNKYGFVPVVLTQHTDIGEEWGVNCFTNSVDKINRMNNLGSYINTLIYKHAEPIYVSYGTTKGSFVKGDRIWHHPEVKGKVEALVPDVDFDALSTVLDSISEELEKDFPELTWHILRTKSELSGKAVKYLLGDVIAKVQDARQNYDEGLVEAQEMGLRMGVAHKLFTLTDEQIEHTIGERPVLGEKDDIEEMVEMELMKEAKRADTTPKEISKSHKGVEK